MPKSYQKISNLFMIILGMTLHPVGLIRATYKPDNAIPNKNVYHGCIMPLLLAAAKGQVIAFDSETSGRSCAAFHLGYQNWIFPGIERFLSHGPFPGRSCEKLVKNAKLAKSYIKSIVPEKIREDVSIFKPLNQFKDDESPEFVIFFVNADQISALAALIFFEAPLDSNRIHSQFASACGACITLPMRFAEKGSKKAVWGLHDITARAHLPKDLMTLTITQPLLHEMANNMKKSFLFTERWTQIKERQ